MSPEELQRLWIIIQQIQSSTSTMNRELGVVQQNLEWLNWAVKGIFVGIVVSVGLSVWNLILHRLNNGRKK